MQSYKSLTRQIGKTAPIGLVDRWVLLSYIRLSIFQDFHHLDPSLKLFWNIRKSAIVWKSRTLFAYWESNSFCISVMVARNFSSFQRIIWSGSLYSSFGLTFPKNLSHRGSNWCSNGVVAPFEGPETLDITALFAFSAHIAVEDEKYLCHLFPLKSNYSLCLRHGSPPSR